MARETESGPVQSLRPSRVDSTPPTKGKSSIPPPTVILILDRMSASAPAGGGRGPSQKESLGGAATPVAGYLGPDQRCAKCEHFRAGLCDQAQVIKDPQLEKKDGKAVVDADGSCPWFEAD